MNALKECDHFDADHLNLDSSLETEGCFHCGNVSACNACCPALLHEPIRQSEESGRLQS